MSARASIAHASIAHASIAHASIAHASSAHASIAHAAVLLALCLSAGAAQAQSSRATGTSPLRACCSDVIAATFAPTDTAVSLWRVAGNASDAATAVPDARAWRRTRVELSYVDGTSHRPQDAATTTRAALIAEGGQLIRAWSALGRVGYERHADAGVRWRHHAEVYDGMQYSWADSIGGDFRRDVLTLATTAASPAWRGWRGGVGVDYALGQGARQNDPRPLSRRRLVELAPALSFTHQHHQFGAVVRREWVREDLEIGGGSSTEYPVLFRLRGIATFDRTQLITGERAMLGRAAGGTLGYAFRGDAWQIAASGNARRLVIDARDGIATPVTGGTSRVLRYGGRLLLRHERRAGVRRGALPTAAHGRDGGIELDARIVHETSRGTDPIFAAVNAIDRGWSAPLSVTWWRGEDPCAGRWRVSAGVQPMGLERRDVAAQARWSVRSWRPTATIGHRVRGQSPWLVALSGSTTRIIESSLDVPQITRITDVIAVDDARLLQTARWTTSLELMYEVQQRDATWARARVGVGMLRHPALLLTDRTARGRAQFTFAWELL